jgi:cytochrome c
MFRGLHYRAVRTGGPMLLLFAGAVVPTVSATEPPAKVDFAHNVVPILKAHCVECHGGRRHEGDFSINTRESILKAEVVEVGKSADSHLIDLLVSNDKEERMPKDKPPLAASKRSAIGSIRA